MREKKPWLNLDRHVADVRIGPGLPRLQAAEPVGGGLKGLKPAPRAASRRGRNPPAHGGKAAQVVRLASRNAARSSS